MRAASIGTAVGLFKQPNIKKPLDDEGEKVFFSYTEGKRTDTYTLDKTHLEEIYTHKFLSMVSWSLARGKKVIINCGEYTYERVPKEEFHPDELLVNPSQIEFVVSELIYGKPAEQICSMDNKSPDKSRAIESSISYISFNKGIFGFLRQLAGHESPPVLFVELEEKRNRITGDESSFNFLSNYDIPQRDNDYSLPIGNNKYLKAPSLKIKKSINFYLSQLDKILETNSIVQIHRTKANNRVEELGMFVEKDPHTKEIIFNLNGQNESHFIDLFIPLALYYLGKKSSVIVDCDIDLSEESLGKLEERVSWGDAYEQIYKGILMKAKAEIYVERRVANPNTQEEHNFIVMRPTN